MALQGQGWVLDEQPSKQPLAQNENGSQFGCLTSY
jgi:hypothetical protein